MTLQEFEEEFNTKIDSTYDGIGWNKVWRKHIHNNLCKLSTEAVEYMAQGCNIDDHCWSQQTIDAAKHELAERILLREE